MSWIVPSTVVALVITRFPERQLGHHHHHQQHHHHVPGFGFGKEKNPSLSSSSLSSSQGRSVPPFVRLFRRGTILHSSENLDGGSDREEEGEYEEEGRTGRNWIEKSGPSGLGIRTGGSIDNQSTGSGADNQSIPGSTTSTSSSSSSSTDDYSLGISGESFRTGELSERMYNALMTTAKKRFPDSMDIPPELMHVYKLYAMDMTAKEATKAALDQNGLDMISRGGDSDDMGTWGDIDSISFLPPAATDMTYYEDMEEAMDHWIPGQNFNFIVRNVPAKLKNIDLSDLLTALDPDGSYRQQAKDADISLPDEDPHSLKALGNQCERRANTAPRPVASKHQTFQGASTPGYRLISRTDLLEDSMDYDGTENKRTLMHVMNALTSHGCLIVDLTDHGTTFQHAYALSQLWSATQYFFDSVNNDNDASVLLPPMEVAEGAGSRHAVVGYNNYEDGNMQFLECRFRRRQTKHDDISLLPTQIEDFFRQRDLDHGDHTKQDTKLTMKRVFDIVSNLSKDVVRIAVSAASMESNAFSSSNDNDDTDNQQQMPSISGLSFLDDNNDDTEFTAGSSSPTENESSLTSSSVQASQAAILLAQELMDDGTVLHHDDDNDSNTNINTDVTMSPLRLCRYTNTKTKNDDNNNQEALSEIFGAHTDTTFITAVPVASVSGLEVYDEDAELWYRPELMARNHWKEQNKNNNNDFDIVEVMTDNGEDSITVELPWYCRYVILMPGEMMQLVTRNEVPAAVHRVVAAAGATTSEESSDNGAAAPRISVPILLRPRMGQTINVARYFGDINKAIPLLLDCDGKTMEEIHDAMQPSSFQ